MAKFLISTTGAQDPVTLADMGYVFFTHPTVNYDLFSGFTISEIGSSNDLQSAITAGYLTATDEFGTLITTSEQIHIATLSGGTNVFTGGTYSRFSIRLNDNVTISSLSATTISGGTIFSASTNIDTIFLKKSGYLLQKAGSVTGSTFAGNPKIATVTFTTSFPNNNYAVTITGEANRIWTIQSKASSGFTINANSNTAFASSNVFWVACETGEGSR